MPIGSSASGDMGSKAVAVSSAEELRSAEVTCGSGGPAHTPHRACQVYINTADISSIYVWAANTWTQIVSAS